MGDGKLRRQATRLDDEFESALSVAMRWHRDQPRKGKDHVPYISHLLGVAALVLEDGGTEIEAAAALLHDTLEDTELDREKLSVALGTQHAHEIVQIVLACSDGVDDDGHPVGDRSVDTWLERKRGYLDHLRVAGASALRVSGADKLHNARALLADVREDAVGAWAHFNAPPADELWFHQSLSTIFSQRRPDSLLTREFRETVVELVRQTDVAAADRKWRQMHRQTR